MSPIFAWRLSGTNAKLAFPTVTVCVTAALLEVPEGDEDPDVLVADVLCAHAIEPSPSRASRGARYC